MKDDPVVSLVTRSGKVLTVHKSAVGNLEELAAHPHHRMSRPEVFTLALWSHRRTVESWEEARKAREESASREEGSPLVPRDAFAEIGPAVMAEIDAALLRALELIEASAARDMGVCSIILGRAADLRRQRLSAGEIPAGADPDIVIGLRETTVEEVAA